MENRCIAREWHRFSLFVENCSEGVLWYHFNDIWSHFGGPRVTFGCCGAGWNFDVFWDLPWGDPRLRARGGVMVKGLSPGPSQQSPNTSWLTLNGN